MSYKARYVYKDNKVAKEYDLKRFRGLKGKIVDRMEKGLIYRAVKKTRLLAPARILDIPCGTGRLSLYLALKGFQVTGIDISQAMISMAQKKIENYPVKDKITLRVGDAEALSFPDSYFDIVVSLRLFGHLPTGNRLNILKEMCRVSKMFVITAYYYKNSIQELLRRRKRIRNGIFWNPVNFNQIDKELEEACLKRMAMFYLLPGVSETIVLLSKKNKNENTSYK
jgi:ubiquinone/menaquinone biosynthesis C-methylase UbiE